MVSVPDLIIETANITPANICCKGVGGTDTFSLRAGLRSLPYFPKVTKESSQDKFKFNLERELEPYWVLFKLPIASQLMTVGTMRPKSEETTTSAPFPS